MSRQKPPARHREFDAQLKSLQEKHNLLSDRARMVATRQATGLWIHGRTGIGKTTIVHQTLRDMDPKFVKLRGFMTASDLFNTLEEHPHSTIVLDDVGGFSAEQKFYNLMLAALEAPNASGVRSVRYGTADEVRTVRFKGGIIFLSNELPGSRSSKIVQAFQSRIVIQHYDPSDAEIEAQIWQIADQVDDLSKRERRDVAKFLIETCHDLQVRPSLRHFTDRALPDFRFWKSGRSKTNWKMLIRSALSADMPIVNPSELTRKEVEERTVLEIWGQDLSSRERLRIFQQRTNGGCRATMYRIARNLRQRGVLTAG